MVKTTGDICPECGELRNINCYDYECDFGTYYGEVTKHFECHKCGSTWSEFYVLVYDGYADIHGYYDERGKQRLCIDQ